MSTRYHVGLKVQDTLRSPKRYLERLFKDNQGEYLSAEAARKKLMRHQREGHTFVPASNECPCFSFETGCPGHPKEGEFRTEDGRVGERVGEGVKA